MKKRKEYGYFLIQELGGGMLRAIKRDKYLMLKIKRRMRDI